LEPRYVVVTHSYPPRMELGVGTNGMIEIFLPSYADYQFDDDLETRQDPVRDIIVTDEEVEKMFPE
jgi:hypothetical protein